MKEFKISENTVELIRAIILNGKNDKYPFISIFETLKSLDCLPVIEEEEKNG